VVALHRAAYLASQEPGDLLVLSYVKTLPVVLSSLYRRLSPQTADRVTFSGVHRLAFDIAAETGQRTSLDAGAAETCFNLAWARHGRDHLDHLPRSYWQEEVLSVIKGRGLTDFDDYRTLSRTGRRTPLSPELRARVWDLFVDYEQRLADRGVTDFQDLVALALRAVAAGAGPRYRFVLVDEAQDLDLLSVRLAASVLTDQRDGLTLVGDGQQSIYPGGYTLKEAGLSVTGRAAILTTNYRNTRQIVTAARALVMADVFDDLDGTDEAGDRTIDAVRDGAAVLSVVSADAASLDVALSNRLRHDRAIGLQDADAAVLCRTAKEADRVRGYLRRDSHPGHGPAALRRNPDWRPSRWGR
jgi:superfamily I DNA/RNA helicase